jgi:ribulose-phosphate 3-epimerase
MTVIPSINCHHNDFECVKNKIRVAEGFADSVHLDIADGVFTFGRSWNNPEEFKSLNTPLNFEVHLMVEEPEKHVGDWLSVGAKRIIVHIEKVTPESAMKILEDCRSRNAEVFLAINYETTIEDLEQYFEKFSGFLFMAQAAPGPSGQRFLPMVLEKIRNLHELAPDVKIEVDGGINEESAEVSKEAGADIVIAGTYVFESDNPKEAYLKLKSS